MNDELKAIEERDTEIYSLVTELRMRMINRKIAKDEYIKNHPDTYIDDLVNHTSGGLSIEEIELYV